MADKKKDINDEDLLILLGEGRHAGQKLKLEKLQVFCGKTIIPMATVTLDVYGESVTETANGNGPVDAAFNAVIKIMKVKVKLEEFLVQAITRGSNDMGKVHIQMEHKGVNYYGFGADTDIITASVEAFIDALSKCIKNK